LKLAEWLNANPEALLHHIAFKNLRLCNSYEEGFMNESLRDLYCRQFIAEHHKTKDKEGYALKTIFIESLACAIQAEEEYTGQDSVILDLLQLPLLIYSSKSVKKLYSAVGLCLRELYELPLLSRLPHCEGELQKTLYRAHILQGSLCY
jgi:hypothetical protein